VPSDVQDASLAPYMEWIQFIPVSFRVHVKLSYRIVSYRIV